MTKRQREIADTTLLPVEKIRPNSFNFNTMTKGQFQELKAEIEHLGTLPQSIVVRTVKEGYEIVDGEHRFKAAVELGWDEVPCNIVEINDFEIRRQSYKRNRSGKDNPVLLGRAFRDMLKGPKGKKEHSIRELAKLIEVSEATIRVNLNYAKAAEVRSRCAPGTADRDIARLRQKQLARYLELPETIRNKWLDSGANLEAFDGIADWPSCGVWSEINSRNLAKYLDAQASFAFQQSVRHLAGICMWADQHKILNVEAYLAPVAELALPAEVLNKLPLEQQEHDCRVLLTPKAWKKVLGDATKRAENPSGILALVEAGVNVALRNAGHDPAEVCGPQVAEALQIVARAPAFIRKADWMTLKEKYWVATVKFDADEDLVTAAKERTCRTLRDQRQKGRRGQVNKQGPKGSVATIFQVHLADLVRRERETEHDELFDEPERLLEHILEKLHATDAIRGGTVDGRPAAGVLAERLDDMDWAEFFLLATGILSGASADDAAQRWLKEMGGRVSNEG